ncbi:hypothetical protein [Oceanospirillum beijerinckii]|uniref:hypothetical protein n=1 Tax=Oceanospirillum beijerinckii TaxID=64976 RepID=UPI0004021445|nr:hypothetical protein [Oceanospirillum beijerinckii]
MNISGVQQSSFQSGQMRMPGPPPSAEDRVDRIMQGIEDGEIDVSELQERLTHDFGDAAEGIISEDGTVDTEALTELFANNQPQGGPPPQGEGGMPPPPPPSDEQKANFEANLVDLLGEDTVSELKDNEGRIDFSALIETLQDYQMDSPVGSLFSAEA